jgi:hypothetical protein
LALDFKDDEMGDCTRFGVGSAGETRSQASRPLSDEFLCTLTGNADFEPEISHSGDVTGIEDQEAPLASGRSILITIIETEIIPRLLLAHKIPGDDRASSGDELALEILDDRDSFAQLFFSESSNDILRRFHALMDRGTRREWIYLELLAPVAQTLSRMWVDGQCTFAELAQGLSRVEDVLQELRSRG